MSIGAVGDFGINRSRADDDVLSRRRADRRAARQTRRAIRPVPDWHRTLLRRQRQTRFEPGGGVDVTLSSALAARAQLDFRVSRYDGEDFDSQRFWFGIALSTREIDRTSELRSPKPEGSHELRSQEPEAVRPPRWQASQPSGFWLLSSDFRQFPPARRPAPAGLRGSFSSRLAARNANAAAIVAFLRMSSGCSRS